MQLKNAKGIITSDPKVVNRYLEKATKNYKLARTGFTEENLAMHFVKTSEKVDKADFIDFVFNKIEGKVSITFLDYAL